MRTEAIDHRNIWLFCTKEDENTVEGAVAFSQAHYYIMTSTQDSIDDTLMAFIDRKYLNFYNEVFFVGVKPSNEILEELRERYKGCNVSFRIQSLGDFKRSLRESGGWIIS